LAFDTTKNGRKRAVFVRLKNACRQSDYAETIWRMAMKLLKFLSLPALLLTTSLLFAQSSLPDPDDSACWQSLAALHNCVQAQQDRAMAQAERCTSYPEYQCQPEPQENTQQARVKKQKSITTTAKAKASANASGTQTPSNESGNSPNTPSGSQETGSSAGSAAQLR
jgi:hypothetical protein